MWVKIAKDYCVNLDQAACVVVQAVKLLDPAVTDSPIPAQRVAGFDMEAHFPDVGKHVLASFPVRPDRGHYQAEAQAEAAFARIMRAAGAREAFIDLTQPEDPRTNTPGVPLSTPAANPIRFVM